jgi:hypothetical protein
MFVPANPIALGKLLRDTKLGKVRLFRKWQAAVTSTSKLCAYMRTLYPIMKQALGKQIGVVLGSKAEVVCGATLDGVVPRSKAEVVCGVTSMVSFEVWVTVPSRPTRNLPPKFHSGSFASFVWATITIEKHAKKYKERSD